MTLMGQAVAFVFGVGLSVQMIAALHAIIDFWYAIGTQYPRVVRGILGWGITIGTIAWFLARPFQTAFVSGLLAFMVFYLSLFVLRHPVLRALERSKRLAARHGPPI